MKEQNNHKENIIAEIEVSYRPHIKPSERFKITSPEDAYQILLNSWDKSKIELVEQFKIILLNRASRVLGICTLTTGTIAGTIVDAKQVFSVALKCNATEVMLSHNHPGGSLIPSNADKEITRKMRMAGQILEIKVLDHIIVTAEGFYSFAKEGFF